MLEIWDTNTRWWLANSSNISTTLRIINAQELHSMFIIYHLGSKELVLNSSVLSSQHTSGCSGVICCNFYINILIPIVLDYCQQLVRTVYQHSPSSLWSYWQDSIVFCRIKFKILNAKKGDLIFLDLTLLYNILFCDS